MTTPASLADRSIAALRANHDDLAALIPDLTDDQLTGSSGASEWTVAQVLSHLGSGSEIGLATLTSAITGSDAPHGDFNQGVWARWNAMTPQDQATSFVEHNAALVAAFEALSPEQRETAEVSLGFVPFPLSLASFAGMRLNEAAAHAWDVHVALDPTAPLAADAAELLAEHFAGGIGFLLGFIGKADALREPALVDISGSGFGITIGDGVSLTSTVTDPTATFSGPLEAAIRLVSGRLVPAFTASDIEVSGNVTLDQLRRVFPGF